MEDLPHKKDKMRFSYQQSTCQRAVPKLFLYSIGDILIFLKKTFRILSGELRPHKTAISLRDKDVSVRYRQALSTLSLSIYFAGGMPISRTNTLAKFRGLIDALSDRFSLVTVSCKCSRIQSQTIWMGLWSVF